MKQVLHYALAAIACTILIVLSLTVGLNLVIPFESIWAEIGFLMILTIGAALFTGQAIWLTLEHYKDKL